jgi:hypothetical protein
MKVVLAAMLFVTVVIAAAKGSDPIHRPFVGKSNDRSATILS